MRTSTCPTMCGSGVRLRSLTRNRVKHPTPAMPPAAKNSSPQAFPFLPQFQFQRWVMQFLLLCLLVPFAADDVSYKEHLDARVIGYLTSEKTQKILAPTIKPEL